MVCIQTGSRRRRRPGQHRPRFIDYPRPAEALPVGNLVKIVEFLPVKRQLCFHHFRHCHPLQFKADTLAAVGKQDVGQLAELVHRVQEGRAERQPLTVGSVRHPGAALPVQNAAQLRAEETVNTSGIAADERRQHRQRGFALRGSKGITPFKR